MSKKRPHNKEEMSSQSGKKKRKVLRFKQVVDFQFTTQRGDIYVRRYDINTSPCRIKINEDGVVGCLIKQTGKWQTIKAHLDWIKIKQVVIKEKKK